MRILALLIPVLWVAACSCNDTEAHEPVFGAELPATNFVIDPSRDTVLKTPGGALISIPAGALDAGGAGSVSLEVKEAYTPADIARGDLRGSDAALTSSGIIYINVENSQSVSIHKPLNVSIPAKEAASDVMVYKAEAGSDAALRWSDARPLTSAPVLPATGAGSGASLFQTHCASCHNGQTETIAPPLAWITRRRDRQWLYAFTRNNATLLWRGDGYSCFLFNRYKTPMPLFKDLTDADLADLYQYIDNASRSIDSNTVADHKRSFDSCVANDPNCSAVAQRPTAITMQQPNPATDTTTSAPTTAIAQAPVTDYYTFAVEKHGWYNVAHKGGSTTTTEAFPASTTTDSVPPATGAEPLLACPCWCNEAAYRRADSLSRPRRIPRHK